MQGWTSFYSFALQLDSGPDSLRKHGIAVNPYTSVLSVKNPVKRRFREMSAIVHPLLTGFRYVTTVHMCIEMPAIADCP